MKVVLGTNVFVAGLRSNGGAARVVLRKAIAGAIQPVFGNALWAEYEDLIARDIWDGKTSFAERQTVVAALAAAGAWGNIHYTWRPNLRDEADNHLIELAVAGGCRAIVTHNLRDWSSGELRWANLKIWTPSTLLEHLT